MKICNGWNDGICTFLSEFWIECLNGVGITLAILAKPISLWGLYLQRAGGLVSKNCIK